tara:strand:- start:1 stop:222 length:222 start_codon:yes stop_codon:yes gene_type:complete
MTEIEQEVKELKKQVKKLTNIVNRLTNSDSSEAFNRFEELYYSKNKYTPKEISEIMGLSIRTIRRYKSQITLN